MSGILGFLVNAASIIVPIAMTSHAGIPDGPATNFELILGNGAPDATGTCPSVAIWDDGQLYGNRIGQYKPPKDCKTKAGRKHVFSISHTQTVPPKEDADPYYIMMSATDDDAICVSVLSVVGSTVSGSFFGDTGFLCGQSWFPSNKAIGSTFQKPKCVWLDGNNDRGTNARALSFHLNDMMGDQDKMAQYRERQDTLCNSSPRFSFWGRLLPDGVPPFFKPKLAYENDNGRDANIDRVLDDPKHPIDKSVLLSQGEARHRRRSAEPRTLFDKRSMGANHDPGHLIVTDRPDASARQVCEHPNSYGWDLVNTAEDLFCDMQHKQLYPLCSAQVTHGCFDVAAKTLVAGLHQRGEAYDALRFGRNYTTEVHWAHRTV